MSAKVSPSSLAAMVSVLRQAATLATLGEWVVVVVPDASEFLTAYNICAAGALPPGSSLGGRTALLPSGGKVSVVAVGTDPFIPDGEPYTVMFAGWGDDIAADNRRMLLWRQRASRVIR